MIWNDELKIPAPLDIKVLVITDLEDIFQAIKSSPSIMCPIRWIKMRNWFFEGIISRPILFWSHPPKLEDLYNEMV